MVRDRDKIYSVSQVNSLIKVVLEEGLPPRLIVAGQVSDWKRHISGHCYFSLKDEGGILPCVMWATNFKRSRFVPENGMAVFATGFIDVYKPGGKYQYYVSRLEPSGVGALQVAFEQMVKRLEAEGLFAEEHKKPIPSYPMRIGVLTSASGAAIRDIAESVHSRWPCCELRLYPVPVQGERAAEQIAAALRDINRRNRQLKLDVVIVGRGGGSLEDLWAFNEEVLARAIFDSVIPIISAVGHEIDTTIADLVADKRASTPTKAGVAAAPDIREVLRQLSDFENRLASITQWKVQLCGKELETVLASAVFRNPLGPVFVAAQKLDELCGRLQMILRTGIHNSRMRLTAQSNRLTALNPKAVLERGYSITTNKKTGRLITKPQDVGIGELIFTELAGGNLIESKVVKK